MGFVVFSDVSVCFGLFSGAWCCYVVFCRGFMVFRSVVGCCGMCGVFGLLCSVLFVVCGV